jgi:hypothetical protein
MDCCHVGPAEGGCLRSRFQEYRKSPYEMSGNSDNGVWDENQVVLEIFCGALTSALKWNGITLNS